MRFLVVACLVVACSAPDRTQPATPDATTAPGLRLPDGAAPLSYALRLDVDPNSENFRGEVRIEVRLDRPTDHVWLHADQLEIASARWDHGELMPLPAKGEQMIGLSFGRVVPAGTVTLTLAYAGKMIADQEGLFRQRLGGAWYVFSQGEAVFARRFVPCFDEPRFKTTWHITLVVPKKYVALANMPEQATTVLAGNRKQVVFAPTPPLPSYLVAIAVGPFDLVNVGPVGRNKVPVRVAMPAGRSKLVKFVDERLPPIVDLIESYLDSPLPYPKLDLVGVPRFFGAMENPGLITFQEPILTASASYFTFIAAHEIAHQWFGNLVTPTWWDHLWLSEAFASWLSEKAMRELKAHDDVPLRLALSRRDAITGDEPLWRDVKTTEQADEGFDTNAYAKGHIVLATLENFVGADAFRTTVRRYVRARGSVRSEDFLAALAPDLAASMQRLARAAEPPVVTFSLSCSGAPKLVASAPYSVPVCIRTNALRTCALVHANTELSLGTSCPTAVLANPEAGFYHTRWTTHGPRGPAPPIAKLDFASRIITGDDLAAAIRRGELTASEALTELRALTDTKDAHAQLGAVAMARALDTLVDDANRTTWDSWLAARFTERLGLPKKDASAADNELSQALVTVVAPHEFSIVYTRTLNAYVDKALPNAQSELPPGIVALAAVHGGDKLFDRIAVRARLLRDPETRDAWLAVLGEFPAAQIPKAIELVTRGDLDPDAAWPAVARYLARGATRTATWRLVKDQLSTILQRMAGEGGDVIDAMAHLCDKATRDEVVTSFAPHLPAITNGKARLAAAVASMDRCIATRAKLGDLGAALAATR